jgi:hypothetical protein
MSRLIETTSSALAAASLLALALGCAMLCKPTWAAEPLTNCNCPNGKCDNPCAGNCLNSQNQYCGCDCEVNMHDFSDYCRSGYYYDCVAP